MDLNVCEIVVTLQINTNLLVMVQGDSKKHGSLASLLQCGTGPDVVSKI